MLSAQARVLAARGCKSAKERAGAPSSPLHSIQSVQLLQRTSPLESSNPTFAPTCEPYLSACVLRTADAGRRGVSILGKTRPIPPCATWFQPRQVGVRLATPFVMRLVRAPPSTPPLTQLPTVGCSSRYAAHATNALLAGFHARPPFPPLVSGRNGGSIFRLACGSPRPYRHRERAPHGASSCIRRPHPRIFPLSCAGAESLSPQTHRRPRSSTASHGLSCP